MTDTVVKAGAKILATKGQELVVSSTAPASPYEGMLWHDLSVNPPQLRIYNGTAWSLAMSPKVSKVCSAITNARTNVVASESGIGTAGYWPGALAFDTFNYNMVTLSCVDDIFIWVLGYGEDTATSTGNANVVFRINGTNNGGGAAEIFTRLGSGFTVAGYQPWDYKILIPAYRAADLTATRVTMVAERNNGFDTIVEDTASASSTLISVNRIRVYAFTTHANVYTTVGAVGVYTSRGGF